MTPFTYKVTHRTTGLFYYGVRYSHDCHPDDLWTTYFTSSKYISNLIELHGKESFDFEILETFSNAGEAVERESFLITENIKDPLCLNKVSIRGGKFYRCGPLDRETIELFRSIHTGRKHSEETKLKISSFMKIWWENADIETKKQSSARLNSSITSEERSKFQKEILKDPVVLARRLENINSPQSVEKRNISFKKTLSENPHIKQIMVSALQRPESIAKRIHALQSTEVREKIGRAGLGRVKSENEKKLLSESVKKWIRDNKEIRDNIIASAHTPEANAKRSKTLTGMKRSEETKILLRKIALERDLGKPIWEKQRASTTKHVWGLADDVYNKSKFNGSNIGAALYSRTYLSGKHVDILYKMFKMFTNGWIPKLDPEWVESFPDNFQTI